MTESVWDYLRPPRVEPTPRRIRVLHGGVTIADSTSAFRVLETSHPPRDPMRGFEVLRDAVALYAQLLDECWVETSACTRRKAPSPAAGSRRISSDRSRAPGTTGW